MESIMKHIYDILFVLVCFETITNDSDAYEMARQLEKSLKLDKVLIFRQYVEWQWVGELENGELSI